MKPQIDNDDIRTSLKEFNTHQGAGQTFAGRVPRLFSAGGAYTASDKALRGKKSLATTDYS